LKLSQEHIDELLSSGIDTLTGSIDGFTQEAYEVHRVGGDIELIKRNLETIAKTRDRLGLDTNIIYKMLVFSHNEHEVDAAQQYCSDLGISFVKEDAIVYDESWLPSYREGEEPAETRFKANRLESFVEFGNWVDDYFLEDEKGKSWRPHSLDDDERFPEYCSWHYGVSVVTGGGPVSPCCGTAKERDDIGRVIPGQVSFGEVWNNENYRHARGLVTKEVGDEAGDVETLCDHCVFPKAIQHLYSLHDLKIITAFHRQFKDAEPALEAGFRFLNTNRYGRLAHRLLSRGKLNLPLLLLARKGSERDMTTFNRFYQEHLLNHATQFHQVDSASRLIATQK